LKIIQIREVRLLKKIWLASLLFVCSFMGAIGNVYADQQEQTAYINVAVATLWVKPHQARPMDQPAISNPVDMRKWTSSMKLEDKLWLVGKLETQALLGNEVTVLETDGDWVPLKQLTFNATYGQQKKLPFILVTKPTTFLYEEASLRQQTMEISYNTRLPLLGKSRNAYLVSLPTGKTAWVKQADSRVYATQHAIPKPKAQDLIRTAKMFSGLPYLWSGMSGFGFDCSGFTFTLHQSHGITIPRDAGPQSRNGKPVAEKDLQPGDLLFFGTNKDKDKVHHVAMYVGDGKMIHSPNSAGSVEIIPLSTPKYKDEFVGGRRYLQ
jgi:cell wall-associated NlpC family hydrolase